MRHRWWKYPAALLIAFLAVVLTVTSGDAGPRHSANPDAEEHEAVLASAYSTTGSCGVERWSVKTGTDADAPEEHQYFQKLEDLKKVDGIEDKVIADHKLNDFLVLQSRVFSVDIRAEMEKAGKQVRTVVFRHDKGFVTILREERADPQFKKDEEGAESDLPPDATLPR